MVRHGLSTAPPDLGYRRDVDGLRGLAVLCVVAYHAGFPGFSGGFVGVDVFFVISGYLISGIIVRAIETGTFSYIDFFARRINRIFPALVAGLLGTISLGWFFFFPADFANLGKHVVAGGVFISNALLIRETGYFERAAEQKPLLHLWSLAIEEQFYLVWPFVLVAGWKLKRRREWLPLAIGAASLAAALNLHGGDRGVAAFYLPITRIWEMVAGFSCFYWQSRHRDSATGDEQWRNPTASVGLGLIVSSVLFFDRTTAWPSALTLQPITGTSLFILAGPQAWLNRRPFANPWLVGFGLISYPLYLWHWPLLTVLHLLRPTGAGVLARGVSVVLAVVLATLTYRGLELPLRKRVPNVRHRSAALLATMAGAVLLGAFAWRGSLPARLNDQSPRIRAIETARADWEFPAPAEGATPEGVWVNATGAAQPDTVLFVGDSHMQQYWPRVVALEAQGGGVRTAVFVTVPGCPVLPGVARPGFSCENLYAALLAYGKAPGSRTIVIGAAWETYFNKSLIQAAGNGSHRPLSIESAYTDSVLRAFTGDVAAFARAGKQVYVVLSNPTGPAFDPGAFIPNRINPAANPSPVRSMSRQEFVLRVRPVIERIRAAAVAGGATVLDPVEYLCGVSTCPVMDDSGAPIYKDGDHLRAGFARRAAAFIDVTLFR